MAFMIEVWGDYALFTRPEMNVELVIYDVMTPCLPGIPSGAPSVS